MKYLKFQSKNKINLNRFFQLFLFLIISSNIQAQILNGLGARSEVYQDVNTATRGEEYSGLAYHPASDVFIMPTDKAIPGQTEIHFKGYQESTGNDFYIDVTNISEISSNDRDFEGLTYLENDFFLLAEEDLSMVYFLQFNYGNINDVNAANSSLTIINAQSLLNLIPLGDIGSDGLEGITFDPILNKLYVIREWGDTELFSFDIVVPTIEDDGNNGNVDLSTISSINLNSVNILQDCTPPTDGTEAQCETIAEDASGLYHLARSFPQSILKNHILILSQTKNEIIEFELEYQDPLNNDFRLAGLNEKSSTTLTENQAEGIAIRDCEIYIASEKGGGNHASLASYQIDELTLNLKIYLEGAYNVAAGEHTASLFGKNLLPGQSNSQAPPGQPYNVDPWNYGGNEGANFAGSDYQSTDVDWVLVSLRSGLNVNTTVLRMAGILQKDGTIRFTDCFPAINFTGYLVVEHRNHLPIMSAQPITINGGSLTYDFTINDSYRATCTSNPNEACTSFGQKEVSQNIWAAYGGNAEQGVDYGDSDDLKGSDKAVWEPLNGMFFQYSSADINLDGDINGADKAIWFNNNGIHVRVNHPLQ